ncbi:RT1 class I histocompatibility antigen, AA alpha chain-like [Brachyistius frenatus]|uniref:RT1 class I histocompatibility antigen, AA alpha chain-like n=1 Tax=Brachyistius frenatus TaxID=100188 RepID=UPI0037E9A4DB
MMEQMKVSTSDVHLRYLYGCEGDVQPDNTLRFRRGVDAYNVDAYNVDGRPILSINDTGYVWVADTPEAEPIAKHWNDDKLLMRVTRRKLEQNCMRHLKNLKEYETLQFKAAPPPDVYMFSIEAKVKNNLVLSCLATGFYPKDIVLKITRNRRVLTVEDGLMSTGVRPNEDDTFQRRDSVEILKSNLSTYRCEIIHAASGLSVTEVWGQKLLLVFPHLSFLFCGRSIPFS